MKTWMWIAVAAGLAPGQVEGLCPSAAARQGGEQKVAFEKRAFPFEGEVSVERLNVRMFPKNDQASIIAAVLGLGEKVTVVGEKDDYYQILPPRGAAVWVFAKNVKKEGAGGTVTANDVPVRLDSRVNADTLATLKEGESVKILAEHMGWLKIEAPASVRYFVGRKYVKAGKELPVALADGVKGNAKRAVAAPGDVRGKIREAESILDEQRRLIDARQLEAVDFTGVVKKYEEALTLAKTEAAKADVESLYKRYKDLQLTWGTIREKIALEKEKLERARVEVQKGKGEPEKPWVMAGYVDTTGSTLFKRPGTHKLVMGGKIVCFLRVKEGDERMVGRLNDHYQKYVGVNGILIKNPDGWDGYSVVVVEDVQPVVPE